jgi:lysozyme-like protein
MTHTDNPNGHFAPKGGEPSTGWKAEVISSNQMAYAAMYAGFSPTKLVAGFSELTTIIAIGLAESGGNMFAHNRLPPDDSYGIWQINMIGDMGPARLKQFGIRSKQALYDPVINAKAAYSIYKSQGFKAWSTYNGAKYMLSLKEAKESTPPSQHHPAPEYLPAGGAEADSTPPSQTASVAEQLFAPVFEFIKGLGMRLAAFFGGGVLIIMGLYFLYKKGMLPTVKKVAG